MISERENSEFVVYNTSRKKNYNNILYEIHA